MPARVLAGLLTAVLAGTLAGCGSGGGHAPSPSPAGTPNTQQVAALYRRLAQCIRQHGVPNLPDPVQNPTTGEWELPPGTAEPGRAAMEACRSLAEQIPQGNGKRARSAADMAQLRKFAQCMRDHGVPDWPDPNSEGAFSMPPRLERLGKRGVMAQLEACKQYNVGRGVTTTNG
ncbi:hypothetical protein ACRYCC_04140 [Actinomadura scrupuli]|uniref:hypothetical protein n=1 Tax=Actinomadura scrupuli TaxID=559629 RepID=UPI003D956919